MKYEVIGPRLPIICTGFEYWIVRDIKTESEYCNVSFRSGVNRDKEIAYKKAFHIAELLNSEK